MLRILMPRPYSLKSPVYLELVELKITLKVHQEYERADAQGPESPSACQTSHGSKWSLASLLELGRGETRTFD
jgi:hypothetical protein